MKALLTTILLGTSSVALAQPSTVEPYSYDQRYDGRFDQRYDDRYDDRFDDHRDDRFDQRMRFRRPVLLASNVSMFRQWHQNQRPQLVNLDARMPGIKKLRLDRNEGRMYINSIVVNFADGHQQTVRVDQALSARQPSVFIELDHGAATSLYVYGSPMRGRATFDVIGLRR